MGIVLFFSSPPSQTYATTAGMENSVQHRLTIAASESGKRIDAVLAAQNIEGLSRSRIKALIEQGQLTINGAFCGDPAQKTRTDEEYVLTVPPPQHTDIVPVDIPLDIVFEDEHLLVINKPAGLTVHPAAGHANDTLVNALLAYCGDSLSGIGGELRPGIVHRLDKDTSGLMLVAKHDAAHQKLSAQLADRSLSRTYQALVWGCPQPRNGTVDAAIARSQQNRKKMAVAEQGGKPAVTHYTTQESYAASLRKGNLTESVCALVECKLETGRTHQIRVHMTHIGHPLVGDPVYGSRSASGRLSRFAISPEAEEILQGFDRQALHAAAIAFIHPATGEKHHYSCNLPPDMREVIGRCRADLTITK